MHILGRLGLAGVMTLLATQALAQGDAVSQTVGHGQINWTTKTITATGSGAPSLKAANVAVARLGAERAAKLDAFRNILEAVKGAKISGTSTAGQAMEANPTVKAQVEGVVKNFKVLDTKYYSDGGVDLIVEVPLDSVTTALLADVGSSAVAAKAPAAADSTGIVINAKGLSVTPALAPRLVDDAGKEIYSAKVVTKDAVMKYGVAGYTKSLDGAMKDARVAGKPLVVKAVKAADAGSSDLVISAADGQKIAGLASALAEGKVIIVTD